MAPPDDVEDEVTENEHCPTSIRTTGTFRDREIDLVGVETVLLRLVEHRWSIIHVHWSSGSQQR